MRRLHRLIKGESKILEVSVYHIKVSDNSGLDLEELG